MNRLHVCRCAAFVGSFLCVVHAHSALVSWDGGGGDFSWQNAANWSTDSLPGPTDDVIINVSSNITVESSANVTIASLQCSNHLALSGGTFRLNGSSVVQGTFSTTGTPMLIAAGAGTEVVIAGDVSVDGAAFEARDGAVLV
ncbi:MAG TPA: hypothetical protein PKH32_14425, partial [Verrucomicrobiota bacterium]|nr:hypothetical protein [Verrucomicrobiota bacterium]